MTNLGTRWKSGGRVCTDEEILRVIAEHCDSHLGIPPTSREIMQVVGISSTAAMSYRLHRLVDDGLCYRLPKGGQLNRAITITAKGRNLIQKEGE